LLHLSLASQTLTIYIQTYFLSMLLKKMLIFNDKLVYKIGVGSSQSD